MAGDGLPPIPKWFRDEMLDMVAMYPTVMPHDRTGAVYWKLLHQVDELTLRRALREAIEASPRFPPPAPLVLERARVIHGGAVRRDERQDEAEVEIPGVLEGAPPAVQQVHELVKAGKLGRDQAGAAYVSAILQSIGRD